VKEKIRTRAFLRYGTAPKPIGRIRAPAEQPNRRKEGEGKGESSNLGLGEETLEKKQQRERVTQPIDGKWG